MLSERLLSVIIVELETEIFYLIFRNFAARIIRNLEVAFLKKMNLKNIDAGLALQMKMTEEEFWLLKK